MGMPPKIVRELEAKHGKGLRAHEQELNQMNRLLMKEILKYLFPGIDQKAVLEARLFEMGLSRDEPDPDAYW